MYQLIYGNLCSIHHTHEKCIKDHSIWMLVKFLLTCRSNEEFIYRLLRHSCAHVVLFAECFALFGGG